MVSPTESSSRPDALSSPHTADVPRTRSTPALSLALLRGRHPSTPAYRRNFAVCLVMLLPLLHPGISALATQVPENSNSAASHADKASAPSPNTTPADPILNRVAEAPLPTPLPAVFSAGSDLSIKYWNREGRLSGTLGTRETTISAIAVAFAKDRKGVPQPILISGGSDGHLETWALKDPKQLSATSLKRVLAHEGGVTTLAVTSDGKQIATGGKDGFIRLWNLFNCRLEGAYPVHDAAIRSLQFSQDGRTLISGGDDKMIRTWKLGDQGNDASCTLEYQSTIQAHDAAVTSVALSPDATVIASVAKDGYLKLWNIKNGILIQHPRVSNQSLLAVAFSPKGNMIATGDSTGKIRLFNPNTGQFLPFVGSHRQSIRTLAWTPDGAMLISGGDDKTLSYWSISPNGTGRNVARLAAHDGTVETIAIMP